MTTELWSKIFLFLFFSGHSSCSAKNRTTSSQILTKNNYFFHTMVQSKITCPNFHFACLCQTLMNFYLFSIFRVCGVRMMSLRNSFWMKSFLGEETAVNCARVNNSRNLHFCALINSINFAYLTVDDFSIQTWVQLQTLNENKPTLQRQSSRKWNSHKIVAFSLIHNYTIHHKRETK
jgi:hypothetical protein